jgi:hypothetical protein
MPEQLKETIVRNLIEALHEDLDSVELWMAAFQGFDGPAPDYWPGDSYLLSTRNSPPR